MVSRAVLSLAFIVSILIVILYMVIAALGMTNRAGLLPIVVGVPTLLAIAIQLLKDVSSFRAGDRHGATASEIEQDRSASAVVEEDDDDLERIADQDVIAAMKKEASKITEEAPGASLNAALISILILFGLVYIFGMIIAIPLFIIAFMRLISKESWRLSIAMAVGTMIITYLFFIQLLGLNLYRGLVGGFLPF